MATSVIMPKLGMTMDEGTIVQWFKKEGDSVEKGQPLLEIETDKVNAEVEAPAAGIVQGISARPDDVVPVARVIAYILAPGESLAPVAAGGPTPGLAAVAPQVPAVAPAMDVDGGRVAISPLARKVASQAGIDLRTVQGTGPGGRIVEADVRAAITRHAQAVPPAPTPVAPSSAPPVSPDMPPIPTVTAGGSPRTGKLVPLVGKRKVIAERMTLSTQMPQFSLGVEADMSQAEIARGEHTATAMLVRVVADALRRHPLLNASYQEGAIRMADEINIGVAVSAADGLVVPVIRQAERKTLPEIDAAIRDLAERARSGELVLDDVSSGTFTISNLGMFGVEEFRALINPPQAAILAVGRITPKAVAVGGQVVVRPILHLVLSADHRIVDGAIAAAFLVEVKNSLENPYRLL